jgi:ribosomal protein S21
MVEWEYTPRKELTYDDVRDELEDYLNRRRRTQGERLTDNRVSCAAELLYWLMKKNPDGKVYRHEIAAFMVHRDMCVGTSILTKAGILHSTHKRIFSGDPAEIERIKSSASIQRKSRPRETTRTRNAFIYVVLDAWKAHSSFYSEKVISEPTPSEGDGVVSDKLDKQTKGVDS